MIDEWVEERVTLYRQFGRHKFAIGYYSKCNDWFESKTVAGVKIHKSEIEAREFIEKSVPKRYRPIWFVDSTLRVGNFVLAKIEWKCEVFAVYIFSKNTGENGFCHWFSDKRRASEFIEAELFIDLELEKELS